MKKTDKKILRIATRKSPLALWQATHIGDSLQHHWPELSYELVPMVTSGDRFQIDKLQSLGGKGLFVKELEEGLLDHRADLAVHSMKDVPVELPEGLIIAAVCQRDNPLDALVSQNFADLDKLPAGSVIGTASLRRQAQLLALRSDLIIKTLRGNINTRIKRMESGEFAAILLAAAGLERLGMQEKIQTTIDAERMLPACAQGALGIECRAQDEELLKILAPMADHLTTLCVQAERRVNARLGGNCHVPLAVYCSPQENDQLLLRARVMSLDGKIILADRQQDFQTCALLMADRCADALIAQGAEQLLARHDQA